MRNAHSRTRTAGEEADPSAVIPLHCSVPVSGAIRGQTQLPIYEAAAGGQEDQAAGGKASQEIHPRRGENPDNRDSTRGAAKMSKGMDSKKNTKKKPAKTLMEKRAARQEKQKKK